MLNIDNAMLTINYSNIKTVLTIDYGNIRTMETSKERESWVCVSILTMGAFLNVAKSAILLIARSLASSNTGPATFFKDGDESYS